MPPEFPLSWDQEEALEQLKAWDNTDSRVFRLGGLAGTGKSSLIPMIHATLGVDYDNVEYITPTRKAGLVLQNRLDASGVPKVARTVHSTIYDAAEYHCRDCPLYYQTSAKAVEYCHSDGRDNCGCVLTFNPKDRVQKPILIICDEASMVSNAMYQDLIFGARYSKIVFVGDTGQLPPVLDNFDLMANPDYELTENHRVQAGSKIHELALQARKGEYIDHGTYSPEVSKVSRSAGLDFPDRPVFITKFRTFPSVDKDRNFNCLQLNRFYRSSLGYPAGHPVVGDRVIAIRVDRSKGIPKGTIGTIREIKPFDTQRYRVHIEVNLGLETVTYEGLISREQFDRTHDLWAARGADLWHYGYCLTAHEAQGSEFDSVVVLEPTLFYRQKDADYARWLYTAITRSKRRLVIVE